MVGQNIFHGKNTPGLHWKKRPVNAQNIWAMELSPCLIVQSLTETGEIMSIDSIATGLAGAGLTAVIILNTADDGLYKWRARAIVTLASSVGTALSLVQCCREGRNMSARTLATLATNAGVLAYSCLQPCVDSLEVFAHTECNREFFAVDKISMPKSQRSHHSTTPTDMDDHRRLWWGQESVRE